MRLSLLTFQVNHSNFIARSADIVDQSFFFPCREQTSLYGICYQQNIHFLHLHTLKIARQGIITDTFVYCERKEK